MRILNRDYDVATDKIKGIEKLELEQMEKIDKCKLTRQIVILDEERYTINAEGDPEMTQAAQEEYDGFVSKIRQTFMRDKLRILDEGYGADEDELEWHITACFIDDAKNEIVGIMEIDTCVRTDEESEGDME